MMLGLKKYIGAAFASAVLAFGLAPAPAQAQQGGYFMAQVVPFAGNFAPRGWAFAHGQQLLISQNTALFSLLGTTYGGDGRTTFNLPDLRGRAILHPGRGPGLTPYSWGQKGGVEAVNLVPLQMPSHDHVVEIKGTSTQADGTTANGGALAEASEDMYLEGGGALDSTLAAGSVVIQNSGGSQAHENRSPYVTINWIIALTGVYPSRN